MTNKEYLDLQNDLIDYNPYISRGLKTKLKTVLNTNPEALAEYKARFRDNGIYSASNGQVLNFMGRLKNIGILKTDQQKKKELAKKLLKKVVKRI